MIVRAWCFVILLGTGAGALAKETAASAVAPAANSVTSAVAAPKSTCEKTYDRLYAHGELKVLVAFGYKDSRPSLYVGDRIERSAFAEGLIAPCRSKRELCGFTRHPQDTSLFEKTMARPDGKSVRVSLRVFESSLGPDDEDNRKNPLQKRYSDWMDREFFDNINQYDIVFYNGHSRGGGGPDFSPPRLFASGEVDFTYYMQEKPGLKKLTDALKKSSSSRLKMLGMYSCASDQHFTAEIVKARPGLALVTSEQLLYFRDALRNLQNTLNGMFMRACEPEMTKSLAGEHPREASRIVGFFKP